MVVQRHIAQQGLLQVLPAIEPVRLEHVGYAAIEALDRPVGLRGPGLGQPVFYAQLLAQLVKLMVAAGRTRMAGKEPVGELLAVVGQHLGNPDRTGLVQCP